MTGSIKRLAAPLSDNDARLELLGPRHYDGLRAACAADPDIWDIYPVNMTGDDFDRVMEARERFHDAGKWINYAVLHAGEVVGISSYIDPVERDGVVEIGGTYIAPQVRGTGFNGTIKRLMIDNALAAGFTRIEFRIDTRNTRSMAAVAKLGATHEGTLRKNRVTWTGYVRDTAVFGLLADEWQQH